MSRIDGREVAAPLTLRADVVVVGSGPAGASVAREAARRGARVVVVEAGPSIAPGEFPTSSFDAMALSYRAMGASVALGSAPTPYLQGKMVGGSSPINGAICWRMPRDVYDGWLAADPALAEALPWASLEAWTDRLEERLNVRPTDPSVAGRKNQLMAVGAEALGLEHRPIRRNVSACEGLGRCMQGCPKGRKLSVDVTLLADAEAAGATVLSSTEVTRIVVEGGRAVGVEGRAEGGGAVSVRAARAVVVAASAVQSPALLLRSGIDGGPVGRHFQCHPGVSMAGRFPEPVRMWEGATQGHEVIGLRHEGLKFEALGFGLAVLATRLDGVGRALAKEVDDMAHQLDWGVAVRAEAEGRVRLVGGEPVVSFEPSPRDVARYRRGLRVLGEMMLAAGADHVSPGVAGFTPRTSSREDLLRLEREGPTRPGAYKSVFTHMFGTCRMGSDPARSVVRPDFRHHGVGALYVADSSVFPTSLGVNPQIPIMAMASLCAERVLAPEVEATGTKRGKTMRTTTPTIPNDLETTGAKRGGVERNTAASDAEHRAAIERTEGGGTTTSAASRAGATSAASSALLTLDALMAMDAAQLAEVMRRGHPLAPDALAGRMYLGVDLSLPGWARKVLWHTFRKTFVREGGEVRGWNVRMEQHGVGGARIPMRDRAGRPITFGHYVVRTGEGVRVSGETYPSYLDYGAGGNTALDLARFGRTPLVAVNAGSQDLLLGWEVFRLGPASLPLPLYWALRYEGPLDEVVPPPRAQARRAPAHA